MRWLAALLVCISVTPVALADSEDDALALTLELVNQIAQIGGLTVDDPDASQPASKWRWTGSKKRPMRAGPNGP